MSRDAEVRDALARFAGRYGPHQTLTYTVESVDEEAMTCEVTDDDGLEHLLRIAPIITAAQSILLYPQAGKKVLAQRYEDSGDWFVCWAEQYYKTTVTVGACILETDGDKWTLKNGAADLKDILTGIVEAVQVIVVLMGNNPDYAKLAQALTDINQLFT